MKLRSIASVAAVALFPYWVSIPAWAQEWDCVMDGDHVCAPGNDQHKPAACYDDGGVIVRLWPCKPWQPSEGYRHSDGTTSYVDSPDYNEDDQ